MRVLVLGASGMLGNAMFRHLSSDAQLDVFGTVRTSSWSKFFAPDLQSKLLAGVDVENFDSLTRAMSTAQPSLVINCVGIVKQLDEAETPLTAIPINSLLPHRLAALCSLLKARLIHFSTDCVFSGMKGMYRESDPVDATDLYGRSKLLGEVEGPHCLTLRTSIIGHELQGSRSLVGWFLSQRASVQGFSYAYFSGLPTIELARIVQRLIERGSDLSGMYHVAAERISKLELLRLIAKEYGHAIGITPSDRVRIDRSLDATRFNSATGYQPPSWGELVRGMRAFG